MKTIPFFSFLFLSSLSHAQFNPALTQLKQHISKCNRQQLDSIYGTSLFSIKGIHYMAPVVNQLTAKSSGEGSGEKAAIDFCFIGDYFTAINFGKIKNDSMSLPLYDDIKKYKDSLKQIKFQQAKAYILDRAKSERVVMINESPGKPQHRAFVMELLSGFYQQGFRYLAMEMLQNRGVPITEINMRNGYLSSEPLSAELIRFAMGLGFKVLPYEDTLLEKHSINGRDAIQAKQIAAILKQDSTAKIIVYGSHGHICEKPIGQDYWPMAFQFKKFTGIDPLTIDQTELTEGSSFEYGRRFYDFLSTVISLNEPIIAFRNNQPTSLLDNDSYDLQVIHPPSKAMYNRPSWLGVSGLRKATAIKPTEKSLFLVQAYHAEEASAKLISAIIPADQTYVTGSDGYYWVYLFPGNYKLFFRDINYNIITTKELTVK